MPPTAVPVHTIIRYVPNEPAFYSFWTPVKTLRYRLFINATHEEVTGDTSGGHWDHDWSCETLELNGTELRWHIGGRNEWATPKIAIKALSERTFATYAEALAETKRNALARQEHHKASVKRLQWNLDEIAKATPPVLPP
jgi:hypothetical protein